MISRRATFEDITAFQYDGVEKSIIDRLDWRALLEIYVKSGPAWVFEAEGQPIVFCGYYALSPGVLQTWMLFNRSARPHAKSVVKEIKKKLEEGFMSGYHRIQTLAYKGEKEWERFIKMMGFKKESDVEAFGPNQEDMLMYKIVRKK